MSHIFGVIALIFYGLLSAGGLITLVQMSANYADSALEAMQIPFGSIRQIPFDWISNPVSDITVQTGIDKCPASHP